MRILRLLFVRQLHIIELMTSDHLFLLFHRKRIPRNHIMNVFLHKHITASCKIRILLAYHRKMIGILIDSRILRTVHKADNRLTIHIAESMRLINRHHSPFKLLIKDRSKLETQPHLLRPNMEQQITGSRNSCILLPFYLGESTQLFRFTLIGEKPRPRISPESHRATELHIRKTIAHTTDHCREIGTYILYFINRIGGICQVIDYKYYILSLFSGHILWDMTAERILKWIHILLILVF